MTRDSGFTEAEWRAYSDALVALRDALPTHPPIAVRPVRNLSGALYEVRAHAGEGGHLLADVAIRPDGTLAPVRLRP